MKTIILLAILINSLYSFGSITEAEYIKKEKNIDIMKIYFEKCVNKNRIIINNKNMEFIEVGDMRYYLKDNINLIPTGNKKAIKNKYGKIIYYHKQMKAEMECMRVDEIYFNCVATKKHLKEFEDIKKKSNSDKFKLK